MENTFNGYIILGIIALLFLCMYGYSYLSVAKEQKKFDELYDQQLAKEAQRRAESKRKQDIINEKVSKFNQRRAEIQQELMLLKQPREQQKVS